MKAPRNIGVSVRDRLTQRARERRENAQLLMTRYAIERVLYRLSVSRYRDRFVLKGAMLFSLSAPVEVQAQSASGSILAVRRSSLKMGLNLKPLQVRHLW